MRINDYFDKVYCINLDKRHDKWQQCIEEFKKHGMQVERFAAVDGSTLPKNDTLMPGEIGCSYSHVAILKQIIALDIKRALILEDDVEFIPGLQPYFETNVQLIPEDWNLLYFGGNHLNPPAPINHVLARITRTYTTSHYGITLNMAKMVVSKIEEAKKQVDVVYSEFQASTRSYTFFPSIAWQRAGLSDIHNIHTDYTSFMKPKNI